MLARAIFFVWTAGALGSLFPAATWLEAHLPIFTVVCLAIPLVSVLRGNAPRAAGFAIVDPGVLLRVTAANLSLLALSALLVEPWSHAYAALLDLVAASARPDPTFAWLRRYPGIQGQLGMLLYSGLVTIYAEELFFRGWLLQKFLRRMGRWRAIALQAALFTLPQLIAAFLMRPVEGMAYAALYAFCAVGCINGWAAARTGSIWPGLIAAPLWNLGFVLLLR